MSKAVMLSVRPKWCEKIASGEKTIEVHKTRPKINTPFKCYIYCTLPKYPHEDFIATDYPRPQFYGGGKVIGECGGLDYVMELAEADKAGRLVVLPCNVGDVVYGFHGEKTILPMEVKWIETYTNGWCIAIQYAPMVTRFYRFSDFGKTVFLTHEEAKKALEAMKDE